MDSAQFLHDLAVVLITAAAVLLIFKKLKQPPVLGYLLAGYIVGPHSSPVLIEVGSASLDAMANIGVIFLVFALGVEFNLRHLYKIGSRAIFCGLAEVLVLIPFGYLLAARMGWTVMDGLLLGSIIALASTAIVARTLLEKTRHHGEWEGLASGTLVAEDIIAILLITLFSSAAQLGDLRWATLFSAQARLAMLVTLILVTGLLAVPRILRVVNREGLEEVRTLTIIGICLAIAFLTEKLGFSAALGAFLAGAMAAAGGPASTLNKTVAPFKEVFGAVFFVSVGMMIDPRWIIEHWPLTVSLVFLIIVARVLVNFAAFAAAGEDKVSAVQASLARLPIGEFSFIIAFLAEKQGLSVQPLYPFAVTLCLATTLASSVLLPLSISKSETLAHSFPVFLDRFILEYQAGLRRISAPRRATQAWSLIRPSLIQIFINLAGIGGVFFAALALQQGRGYDADIPGVVWGITALLTLPFLNALSRKTQAVTLILIEALAKRNAADAPPFESHPRLTRFIIGLSTALVAWWYLTLSLKLLPPWPYNLIPLAVIGAIGAFLWRRMSKFYAVLQAALRDTFAEADAQSEASPVALSHFVDAKTPEKVRVSSFHVVRNCWAAGQAIRDIDLRSRTGASVLQINRGVHPIPSPSPENHLHVGDVVLLIGEPQQLEAAERILESGLPDTE